MSETALDISSDTPADAGSSPDFSVSYIDIPAEAANSESPDTGTANAPDYDSIFGLEPESKQTLESDTDTPDVPPAADPPASRQSAEVETDAKGEGDETPDPDAKEQPKSRDFNDKLNWDSAPKQFREEFDLLKKDFLELAQNAPEAKFLNDPNGFTEWMKETSPTSFQEIGKTLATESATQFPKEWTEFLLSQNPDIVAELVSGREGMTLDRLKAELDVILDDDDLDVQARLEEMKAAGQKAETPESPEMKELREWREERERQKQHAMLGEVFGPVESAINGLVSEAGLEIDLASIRDKDIGSLSDEERFKVMVNELIPVWIDRRVRATPELASMQARLEEFLNKNDVVSAKRLQHPMRIAATNFAAELIGAFTNARAKTIEAKSAPPTTTAPNPIVKSASAAAIGSPESGEIDWSGVM